MGRVLHKVARLYVESTCTMGGVGGVVFGFFNNVSDSPQMESLHPLVRWSGFSVVGAVTGPVLVPGFLIYSVACTA